MAKDRILPPAVNVVVIGIGLALVLLVALATGMTSRTHSDAPPAAEAAEE